MLNSLLFINMELYIDITKENKHIFMCIYGFAWLVGKAMVEGKKWYYYSRRTQNRITTNGYWKSLGCDEQIISSSSSKRVGVKKYYVFHIGEAPEGVKTNWIMQEFRLSDGSSSSSSSGRSKRKGHSKTVSHSISFLTSYHHILNGCTCIACLLF